MPESVTDRCTKAHEYVFLLSKQAQYYYDADAIKEPSINAGKVVKLGGKSLSNGQASGAGVRASGNGLADSVTVTESRNRRSVWTIPTQPCKAAHFATYPEKLVAPCILAGSPDACCRECGKGYRRSDNEFVPDCQCDSEASKSTVLDPFTGSGTTGKVALDLGRQFIGLELNSDYAGLAKKRICAVNPLLFS